jgi:hypothetical protein
MFVCDICDVTFSEPIAVKEMNGDGENRWEEITLCCPVCLESRYSAINDCPVCDAWKLSKDILCKPCRAKLRDRFIAFADELTAEEEEQLDEWLDGVSITERKRWF